MKIVAIFANILLIQFLIQENLSKVQSGDSSQIKNSKKTIKALEDELSRIEEFSQELSQENLNKKQSAKISTDNNLITKDLINLDQLQAMPEERELEDQDVTHTVTHTAAPFGMMTPSLLPPPPPIFSTGKLPVTTQYQIVHYPAHVNTPWNLLSYPRVMAPHYGYMGYPLHPYNYMHMAHAAHTAMLGAQMGYPGAFANPYIHSPYSMGLHPFGYLPPVGMPFMPYSSYGLGGFSSPFPYGAYGSFGYASGMMGKRKLRKRKLL
jgi:hypothetical protein